MNTEKILKEKKDQIRKQNDNLLVLERLLDFSKHIDRLKTDECRIENGVKLEISAHFWTGSDSVKSQISLYEHDIIIDLIDVEKLNSIIQARLSAIDK